ncbi:aliphatic sulfonate ABC transporter substrate-binding protein [Methylobacterium sp. NFXW15]|uniref:aliphatic sulfonate ABC transporter substrate-binding protein n=1 Tax=Methylobacterium sp. NFXW15 TaxID=2819512 RepID=UPI003CEEB423
MLHRRHILSGLAGLATLPTLKAARAAEPGVLRIGYQKNGILVVAKQQRAIEAALEPLGHRVTWVEFSFGPPLLEALSLDGIDFGQTGDAPPIFAQAAKSTLVYAAAQEAGGSGSGILLPKGSTLKSLADLKGKRVAFAKASSAHNLTVAALEKAGLTYADIEPVTLAPADAAAAFSRGSIDAWTIWDPYYAIAEAGDGVRVLATAQDIAPQNNFFLAGRSLAEQRPAVLSAAVGALERVAAWCTQNRGEVAALLSQGTGVPLAATRRAVDRTDYVIGPMTPRVAAAQQAIADRFHALKLIPRPIRVADAVWTAPARNG